MTAGQKRKCAEIAEHYGRRKQEAQTISELSELLYVLTRRSDQRGIDWKNDLVDELADCSIMFQQVMMLYGISADEVNERIKLKLNRQIQRMKGE